MLRFSILLLIATTLLAEDVKPEPIAIADLKRAKPVDFATEVIPLFQKNCLACHNAKDAKGDLVLESPTTILKGGETGPAVVPGKSAESLLLKLASHQTRPLMPPKDNKADAKPLTSDELGLVKLWIDQGATGTVSVLPPLNWQSLPESFNPIQASAISPDGQIAVCSRANHVDVYELATLRYIGSLDDPKLGAADHDVVESLAFSPDSHLLAVGSYRNVKLWRFDTADLKLSDLTTNAPAVGLLGTNEQVKIISADTNRSAVADRSTTVRLFGADGKEIAALKGDRREKENATHAERALNFAKSETAFRKSNVDAAEKQQKAETEALKKVTEAKAAADKTFAEKTEASKKAGEGKNAAQKALNDINASVAQANDNKNLSQKLVEAADVQAKSAAASADDAAKIFTRAQNDRDAAYAEIINLAAIAKAAPDKTPEANAAIDRALVIKLSFEHAQNAKTVAEKGATEAATNAKLALENKGKAEKSVADLTNQQKDTDTKFKSAEKQLADAEAAAKQAEMVVKNVETNLQGTTAVAKKADESVAEAKKLFASAESAEKTAQSTLEAANKRSAESEKKTTAIAFVGPWLMVHAEDGTVRCYSAETGRPGPVLKAAPNAFAEKSAAFDQSITWKLERQIGDVSDKSPLADRVLALDFSADGKLLATGGGVPSRGGELKIWNVADGALVREIKDTHSDTVFAVRFSPDQMHLASGGADKLMKVFEVASGKFIRSFEGHTHHVLNVSWIRHGRTLASAGADSAIKVWDFASGEQKKTITGVSREITALQFLDSSTEALAASGDNQLRLLREDGGNVRTFSGASDYTQTAAITPDGRWLVAGGSDSQFRLWNGEKGDLLKTFAPPSRQAKILATSPNP